MTHPKKAEQLITIIVLGDVAVGKKNFIGRYCNEVFSDLYDPLATISGDHRLSLVSGIYCGVSLERIPSALLTASTVEAADAVLLLYDGNALAGIDELRRLSQGVLRTERERPHGGEGRHGCERCPVVSVPSEGDDVPAPGWLAACSNHVTPCAVRELSCKAQLHCQTYPQHASSPSSVHQKPNSESATPSSSMFPPIDDTVLQNNPDFANLYAKLTNVILNPDGSTNEDPAAKERAAVSEELKSRRLHTAKQHILTRAIATATPPAPSSSTARPARSRPSASQASQTGSHEPLLDLLMILPLLLDAENPLPQDSVELLFSHPPLSDLETLLPELAPLVSANLRSSALSLTRLTHPTTNPSFLHRHVSSLPLALTTLLADQSTAAATLTAARLHALTSLTTLLHSYAQAMTYLIRTLELKHGVIARSLELRASEVSLSAQRHQADAEQTLWSVRREVYTPEVVAALKNYAAHLRDAKVRGEERVRGLKAELGEYGVGVEGGESKEKMMREMARVYREMVRQVDDVKGDLERLNKG
ncbi:hypothetical protein G7046_g6881 [Stylonectria norvegica]|nr:hypothetical protein G7046_g6881 [Stylonectria norvegica]